MEQHKDLSWKMTVLRYRDSRLFTAAILVFLGLSLGIAGIFLNIYGHREYVQEQANPVPFDEHQPKPYSYVRLSYLTDNFAEHNQKGTLYFIGFDVMMTPYVIAMQPEAVTPQMRTLMDYTSGLGGSAQPEAVEIRGYGKKFEPELLEYARDAYSSMWGDSDSPYTMEELSGIIGRYYLDAVPRSYFENSPWGLAFCVNPFLLIGGGVFFFLTYRKKLRRQKRRLTGREEIIWKADQELADTKELAKGLRIYLTEHYIVSGNAQFEVIPYDSIEKIQETRGMVLAITNNNYAHVVAFSTRLKGCRELLRQALAERIQQHCPQVPLREEFLEALLEDDQEDAENEE